MTSRCNGCPFTTRCISGRGPKNSPYVIIGESPGSTELAKGYPFAGPGGIMLFETLKRAGYDAESPGNEPYIINAINCYPSDKDKARLEMGARSCQGRLLEDLKAYPRKAILALGNAAMWSATNDWSLKSTQDRGRIIDTDLGPVVLASHPAYVMRNGSSYGVWAKDLSQFADIIKGQRRPPWQDPTYEVIDCPSKYIRLVEEYTQPKVGIKTGDAETDAFHWLDGRMICMGITKGDGNHVHVITEQMLYASSMYLQTKKLFETPGWNWFNGLFDIKWLMHMGIAARVHEDPMLLSYTLNENGGYHDLDQVAQRWIGAPKHKHMLDQYKTPGWSSYRDFPRDVLHKYNATDLSKTHKLLPVIRQEVAADPHSEKLYTRLLIPATTFIARMQLYGVEACIETIRANELQLVNEIQQIEAEIDPYAQKHIGASINIGSPKQLANLLYNKMGYGRPGTSTDAAALEEIDRAYNFPPIIALINRHRELNKRKGTYVTNMLDRWAPKSGSKKLYFFKGHVKANGRVHADIALHKTATGRLAGSNPNLLNQPRGSMVRSQYKASKGKIFVEVDLNQAELRSLALMSGDALLCQIYTENKISIHDVTTEQFYAPKKEIYRHEEDGAFGKVRRMLHLSAAESPEFVYKQAKMRGKAVNFGIVYGREAFSLAKEFNISIAEAQRWIDAWFDLYPGAAAFIRKCRDYPLQGKNIITVFGRKKRHGLVGRDNLRDLQNQAANFPHQSTAADIMLETAIEVDPVLEERWGARIWLELYDAIYFEIDDDNTKVAEAIAYVQEVITRVPRDRGLTLIPFIGDAKVGYTWGSMHDWQGSIEASLPSVQ